MGLSRRERKDAVSLALANSIIQESHSGRGTSNNDWSKVGRCGRRKLECVVSKTSSVKTRLWEMINCAKCCWRWNNMQNRLCYIHFAPTAQHRTWHSISFFCLNVVTSSHILHERIWWTMVYYCRNFYATCPAEK